MRRSWRPSSRPRRMLAILGSPLRQAQRCLADLVMAEPAPGDVIVAPREGRRRAGLCRRPRRLLEERGRSSVPEAYHGSASCGRPVRRARRAGAQIGMVKVRTRGARDRSGGCHAPLPSPTTKIRSFAEGDLYERPISTSCATAQCKELPRFRRSIPARHTPRHGRGRCICRPMRCGRSIRRSNDLENEQIQTLEMQSDEKTRANATFPDHRGRERLGCTRRRRPRKSHGARPSSASNRGEPACRPTAALLQLPTGPGSLGQFGAPTCCAAGAPDDFSSDRRPGPSQVLSGDSVGGSLQRLQRHLASIPTIRISQQGDEHGLQARWPISV